MWRPHTPSSYHTPPPLPTSAESPSSGNTMTPARPNSPPDSNYGVQSLQSSFSPPRRRETATVDVPGSDDGDQSVLLRDALRMAMTMSGESKDMTSASLQQDAAQFDPSLALPTFPRTRSPPIISSRPNSPAEPTTPISLSLSTPASSVSLSSVPASMALSMDLDSDTDMETDMDASTSWSLYGSSSDSRAGSPAARRAGRPDTGAPDGAARSRNQVRSAATEGEAVSSQTTRVPYPYIISRRNTATIPQIIRNTSTNTRSRDDSAAQAHTATGGGSFQSDTTTTTTDAHSRAHWAVQESLDRQRYQGDLFDLVLPILELPGASVSSTMSGSTPRSETGDQAGKGHAGVTSPSRGSATRNPSTTTQPSSQSRDQGKQGTTLSIVLCGTNRTTNGFLRELMRDSRFQVYKFPPSATAAEPLSGPHTSSSSSSKRPSMISRSVSQPDPVAGRTIRPSQPGDQSTLQDSTKNGGGGGGGAYYTVGVYAVDERNRAAGGAVASQKKLLARIKVFGKGQNSNLENAISYIKHTYTRLDSLLRPPMREEEEAGSMGSSDMYGLVESWVWGGPGIRGGRPDGGEPAGGGVDEAEWCELAVLTGDGRHLLERAQMEELVAMVPTMCFPEDLSSLLSLACGLDFYTPELPPAAGQGQLRRHHVNSDLGEFSDLLVAIANDEASDIAATHRKLRKHGIRSFLQWRSLNLQRSRRGSTILGTSSSHGATSTASFYPSQSKLLGMSADQALQEPSPTDLRPLPTLARARGSYEGQPGNWEAGLSRRIAARRDADKERLAKSKRRTVTVDPSTLGAVAGGESGKRITATGAENQEHSGFFDDRCVGAGYGGRGARGGGLGVVKGLRAGWDIVKAFVYPLSYMYGVISPETTTGEGAKGAAAASGGGWGIFKVACVGLVVGLAGLWLARL